MSRRLEFTGEAGLRLDRCLALQLEGYSRAHVKGLIEAGHVTVDGAPAAADRKLKGAERIVVALPQAEWAETAAFERWVLHEDKALLVLDKPAGLLMHPLGTTWLEAPEAALAEPEANLAGLLQRARPEILKAKVPRCGIVHRLDRQTSGVLLVAKTAAAYAALIAAFKERAVSKRYRAIVRGTFAQKSSQVTAPIGRKPGHRRVTVTPFGKSAETAFTVVEKGKGAALVEARPLTGRTHQIRAHLALLGHPVAGDVEFEAPRSEPRPPRLMLHAYQLEVAHPATGKALKLRSPLPADFKAFWKVCR